MAKSNPLIRSYPKSINKPLPHKSKGILDDYAIRKVIEVKDTINAGGYITGKKTGVYFVADPHNIENIITINEIDVWQSAAVILNLRLLEDFTLGIEGLTYLGEKTQYFKFHAFFTTSSDINNTTMHLAVRKNGIIDNDSQVGYFFKFLNEEMTVPFLYVVELKKGDILQVDIMADTLADLALSHATVTINEFFD